MCVSNKQEVSPGLDGLLDAVDQINDVQSRVVPLLNLIIHEPLSYDGKTDSNDNANLLSLVRDELERAWAASEVVYAIYRKEVAHAPDA